MESWYQKKGSYHPNWNVMENKLTATWLLSVVIVVDMGCRGAFGVADFLGQWSFDSMTRKT